VPDETAEVPTKDRRERDGTQFDYKVHPNKLDHRGMFEERDDKPTSQRLGR